MFESSSIIIYINIKKKLILFLVIVIYNLMNTNYNMNTNYTQITYNPKASKSYNLSNLTKVKGKMMSNRHLSNSNKRKLAKLKTKWMTMQRTIKHTQNTHFDESDNEPVDNSINKSCELSPNIVIWDFSSNNSSILNNAISCNY